MKIIISCAFVALLFITPAIGWIMGFQYRDKAQLFLGQLKDRLAKFGLEYNPEKTRLIEFGRFAIANRTNRGEGKPETFDLWVSRTYVHRPVRTKDLPSGAKLSPSVSGRK